MSRLNAIETECQTILVALSELMSPGNRKLTHEAHMELSGRVRDVLRLLQNKEYGCYSGLHAGPCQCPKTI